MKGTPVTVSLGNLQSLLLTISKAVQIRSLSMMLELILRKHT